MNSFIKRLPFNYFHYYAFSVLIVLLCFVNYLFILMFIPYFYLIRYYKHKYLIVIVSVFFFIYINSFELIFKKDPENDTFKIVNKINNDTYYTYYVKESNNKYVFYSDQKLNVGDVLKLNYSYEEFSINRTPNGFNLKNYYMSKRVFYKLNVKEIEVVNNEFQINKIKEKLIDKLECYEYYSKLYLKMFIFNIDESEKEFKEARVSLGIVHLFLLSGLHLNFLISSLRFILGKFNIKLNDVFLLIVLLILLWFSGFSVSLIRIFLVYLFTFLFKGKGLTRLDSLSLSFLVILLINPFNMYMTGFVLSFLISFVIVIVSNKKGFKNLVIRHLKVVLVSILIISNINGKIYPLSFLTSFIFMSVFPIIILPVIYLSVIPFISSYMNILLSGFTNLILYFDTEYYFKMPYLNVYIIIIYLCLFIYVIYEDNIKVFLKRSVCLLLFIGVLYISPNFNFNSTIYFLDVNQGDATFIFNKYNKGNVLIDANIGTKAFLDTLGNITIDYFFITHGDLDHAYDALAILNDYEVKNIIVSPYDNSKIINELKDYNLIKASVNDTFSIGDIKIEVLGPLKRYNSLNNNSLVLKLNMFNEVFLFTGDIEFEAINDLVKTYKYYLKSDLLHVSHHGAYNGTTSEFLYYVRPKEALISVGLNNIYNHPDTHVISLLKSYNVKIYLTSKSQTIIKRKYKFSFKDLIVKQLKI